MMESESSKNVAKICLICELNPSKYLCPRCGVPYCSLACYKNESKHFQCSESFYRDCVMEHVRSEQVVGQDQSKKMKEVLQRLHEEGENQMEDLYQDELEDELDSDDDEPLDKRLAGVDLNDSEEVWKRLTDEEKKDFQTLVKNSEEAGDIIIPEWVPWWYDQPEKKLVVEVSENANSEVTTENPLILTKRQPQLEYEIPRMIDLTKIKPNEHVVKGLINVIAAYVWTSRLYNGDLFDSERLIETASSLVCLSSYLNKNVLFKNIEHAVADVPMNACKVPALSEGGTAIQTNLNRDVWILIKGPEKVQKTLAKAYLLSALTECYALLVKAGKLMKRKASNSLKTHKNESTSSKGFSSLFPSPPPVVSADSAILSNCKRKILYLLAFANEYIDNYREMYTSPVA